MKYIFLSILFLMSFAGSVLGSETYQFTAYVRNNQPLVFCEKEYIDYFNKTYGKQYKYEDPFVPVYFDARSAGQLPHFFATVQRSLEIPNKVKEYDEQKVILKEKFIDSIEFLPFDSFVTWNNEFKSDKAVCLSVTDESHKKHLLIINVAANFTDTTPRDLLSRFKEKSKKVDQEIKTGQVSEHQKRLNKDFWWITIPIATMYIVLIGIPIIAAYALYKKHHVTAG